MRNKLVFIFAILLMGFFVHAVTLEEVLESYGLTLNESDYEIKLPSEIGFVNGKLVGVDENSDSFVDKVNLELTFETNISSSYELRALIFKVYSSGSNSVIQNVTLNSGITKVFVPFGIDFFREESEYSLDLSLFTNGSLKHQTTNFLLNFTGSNFPKKKLPELEVLGMNYSNETGVLSFVISNSGEKDAFGFVYEVFDSNFSVIDEKLIPMLLHGENQTFEYNLSSNLEEILVVVDSSNFVEENNKSNNLGIWPIPESALNLTEICDDGLDNDNNGLIDENCPNCNVPKSVGGVWSFNWCNIYLNESLNFSSYINNSIFDVVYGTQKIENITKDRLGFKASSMQFFEDGEYVFNIGSDDGSRLYLNGGLIIDNWKNQSYKVKYSNKIYLNGSYNLSLEYFENSGDARVSFNVSKAQNLSRLVLNDSFWNLEVYDFVTGRVLRKLELAENVFDLVWNSSVILETQKDKVGINMVRSLDFASGSYVFEVGSDDGSRLYVDGNLVIDNWKNQSYKTKYSSPIFLNGTHNLSLEYFENSGDARFSFKIYDACSNVGPIGSSESWNFSICDMKTQRSLGYSQIENESFDRDWSTSEVFGAQKDSVFATGSRNITFDGDSYVFGLGSDDGSRLYVNGELIVDNWKNQSFKTKYSDKIYLNGTYEFRIEYFENSGNGRLYFEVFDTCPESLYVLGEEWVVLVCDSKTGRLLKNTSFSNLTFDLNWGKDSVFGVQKEGVEVLMSRNFDFPTGVYNLSLGSDDGVRFWIDDELLVDDWKNRSFKSTRKSLNLSGNVSLRVKYFENSGDARILFDLLSDVFSKPVKPILECVKWINDSYYDNETNETIERWNYTAYFGYLNQNAYSVFVPSGDTNKLVPALGEVPQIFSPGRTPYYPNAKFSVDFNGSNLVWSLLGRTSTASNNPQQRCRE